MLEQRVRLTNKLGLHARAAAKVVRRAGRSRSTIRLERVDTGAAADARSILSVLHLAAAHGTELVIIVNGDDEGETMNDIVELFNDRFGEDR